MKTRQTEREGLLTAIGAAEAIGQLTVDCETVKQKVLNQIGAWGEQLATNPRQVLREGLAGPIRFTPDGREYQFEGPTSTGVYIAGLIGDPP